MSDNETDDLAAVPSSDDAAAQEAMSPEAVAGDVAGDGAGAVGGEAGSGTSDGHAPVVDDDHDQRGPVYAGWAYLAFLFALFLGLALVAYSCDDSDSSTSTSNAVSSSTTEAIDAELRPVALEFAVDGDQVTLRGAVPDEGARTQLITLAEARYGEGNVIDELTVDAGTTLVGGSLSILGTTSEGDESPEGLQADVAAALGLDAGAFDVTFEEVDLTPIDVEVAVAAEQVTLRGVVPDQDTVDGMVGTASDLWGATNVDGSGLSVDALTTLAGGQVRLTGSVDAGDARLAAFANTAATAFGVTVDNAVEVDTSAEALGRLETRLREQLAANPILFATGSADIDPVSDEILQQAADAINAAPDIAVEIVGHTDDQGGAEVNQVLSEERAAAVLDRLVELGVDAERLTARGAGEDEPVADNATEEGRAANRRIAFEFAGAGDGS
jgi:outer membrane protein OmpA-like peptidoglycan-associated protein